ncbi:MAG: Fic family protein [Thermoplasmata archaeon]|nr:Fic family protein [Thermoplasmata archaeon]
MPASKPDTSHGFRPSVPYSEDIVRPANEILRLDGRLETRLLSTQLHQVVLGVARLRNAVSSLRMEGEVVEMDRARAVLEGGRPTSPTEDGFLRLAKAYGGLSRGVLPELSIRGIVQKHRELFDGVLESASAGRLKTEQNSIISSGTGRPIFLPTPPERVEAELNALLDWYRTDRYRFPSPVTAGLFFAEFQAIHPFGDGNGRIGRYLNSAILQDLGLKRISAVPLDLRFFRSSDHYYEFLATTNSGSNYALWIRYFVKEVEHAYRLADRQANLAPVVNKFTRPSTRSVLRWVLGGEGGWFRRGDFPNPRKLSAPAVWAALDELRRGGIVEARGERRGRAYRLNSRFLAELYAARLPPT